MSDFEEINIIIMDRPVNFEMDIEITRGMPEKELMRCVLMRAVEDLYSSNKGDRESAREYFNSQPEGDENDDSYIFSFVNICSAFNLSPEDLRKQIFSLDGKKRTRMRVR